MTTYICRDERRREAVRAFAGLNGIDFLEVVDRDAANPADRQRVLRVTFLKTPAPRNILPANVAISGGDRIQDVRATAVTLDGEVLVVQLDRYGDFSNYRFALVKANGSAESFDGLDPLLASVDFSFKVECPNEFDCKIERNCLTAPQAAPDINYLAKDYATFRQVMLDRLSVLTPEWRERNAADVGIALVELLASVGDYLSYRQDSIATEAYLGTCRRRVSARRHARLVDYFMHDGISARVFVHVEVDADITLLEKTKFLTFVKGQAMRLAPESPAAAEAASLRAEIFESLHQAPLFRAHNTLLFHTWGDGQCCLPKGATRATLRGALPDLTVGTVLIFEEMIGPETGKPGDADPGRRHAVRLTRVTPSRDPIGGQFETPPSTAALDVTEIEWSADDALPFPLCISVRLRTTGGEEAISNVTVARGNIVLADHGLTIVDEFIGTMPEATLSQGKMKAHGGVGAGRRQVQPRFRPSLRRGPLTHAVEYDEANPPVSAAATLGMGIEAGLPQISLIGTVQGRPPVTWTARRDLLAVGPDGTHFVVEIETDGTAFLRFGDDAHGKRPAGGTAFAATYRTGNGVRGNVGAEAIRHVISSEAAIRRVRNPLPAYGGIDPESIESVRQNAPFAFRTQERAVTADDYATIAQRFRTAQQRDVQSVAASFRWTGSWHTAFLNVDRLGAQPVDAGFETEMRRFMEPFRLLGHDLEVEGPRFVPLEIEMRVCLKPDYFRSRVKAALMQIFGNGVLPDGRRGLFHPDNFTFGQTIYLSRLYAAAQAVDGVASVQITTFQRQGQASDEGLDKGKLELSRLEIARLDNDPDFPERGVFRITLEAGK